MARSLIAVTHRISPDAFGVDLGIKQVCDVRDIGLALGVSLQRAHQVVNA